MVYIFARHGTEQTGKEHFSSFSLLCYLLFSLPLWISLWKAFSKLNGGLVQRREGSFHEGAEGNVCSWSHPVESLRCFSRMIAPLWKAMLMMPIHSPLGQQCPPHLLHLEFIPTWSWLQLCLFRFYKLVGIISKLVSKQTNKQNPGTPPSTNSCTSDYMSADLFQVCRHRKAWGLSLGPLCGT